MSVTATQDSISDRREVGAQVTRTVGETLNWERVPTPTENDLAEIAKMFVEFARGDSGVADGVKVAKIITADQFTENDRWDITRFWTEEELVALGHKECAITRVDFIDETRTELEEISMSSRLQEGSCLRLRPARPRRSGWEILLISRFAREPA